ncbi:hypothetical protein L209DRAFT_372822 [Thermothelomyces heterothallicus CBS 203.75]
MCPKISTGETHPEYTQYTKLGTWQRLEVILDTFLVESWGAGGFGLSITSKGICVPQVDPCFIRGQMANRPVDGPLPRTGIRPQKGQDCRCRPSGFTAVDGAEAVYFQVWKVVVRTTNSVLRLFIVAVGARSPPVPGGILSHTEITTDSYIRREARRGREERQALARCSELDVKRMGEGLRQAWVVFVYGSCRCVFLPTNLLFLPHPATTKA